MQLVVSEFGAHLGKTGDRFTVRRNGSAPAEAPAEAVRHILITGKGVSVSSDALEAAARLGVSVAFMNWTGQVYAELAPPETQGHALLRRAQLRATAEPAGAELARAFVTGKLRNQAANLRYYAKARRESAPETHAALLAEAERVNRAAGGLAALETGTPDETRARVMGWEAQGAAAYWAGVAALLPPACEFPGRRHRGADDPVNMCINYGYGILYSRVWAAVLHAGLDPYAGVLHSLEDGKPAFVYDFTEEFRPFAVDRPVFSALSRGWRPLCENTDEGRRLAADTRKDLAARILKRFDEHIDWHGRATAFDEIIRRQARAAARHILNEGAYTPFAEPW